ncbi:hypothetical protein [Tenacibaculum sp. M341]|uniref:hypothetical protein n=1 Tax=Tenacibaculum sp. M341 TaxID=2530339 RepID=UPI00104EB04E|nr:hypothetical protein [Tenacibaculum sp. M341]TCI85710.1 hypothetical protein EYW44_16120 [Tenacibaculum sp. M341]
MIELKNIEPIHEKLQRLFKEELGKEVEFLNSFIFFASSTTMKSRMNSNNMGWHTDGSCSFVDGDCYNVWIPIYNDSKSTGLEVVSESENPELYAQFGDPTEVPIIYSKENSEEVFGFFKNSIPEDTDLIVVKVASGLVLPISKKRLKIDRYENPSPGDIVVFKQSELHRGFHDGGIRIQLSLKFRLKNAEINKKTTNQFYKLFETVSPEEKNFNNYQRFLEFIFPQGQLSKHGNLENEAINSLLYLSM